MPLPFDLSATSVANLTTQEKVVVSASTISAGGLVFLTHSPFFAKDLSIQLVLSSGASRTLQKNIDYTLVGRFQDIAKNIGGVYTAIYVPNQSVIGDWYVNYRALGGSPTIERNQFLSFFRTASAASRLSLSISEVDTALGLTVVTDRDLRDLQNNYAVLPLQLGFALPLTGTATSTPIATPVGSGGDPQAMAVAQHALQLASAALTALPVATQLTLGGVKQGPGVNIASDGTLSVTQMAVAGVSSVNGQTGTVVLTSANIQGLGTAATQAATSFATSVQGGKADSSVQTINGKSGNTITLSAADVGALTPATASSTFATIAQGTKANTAVQSVNGKTGNIITLTSADIGALTQTSADSRYATVSQGAKADTALQSIPVATTTTLGGVKQGPGTSIGADGTISATGSTSPNATTTTPGLVQLTGDLGGTATAPIVVGLSNKQDRLVSNVNIKTIGGNTLLGTGDIAFPTVTPAAIGAVATSAIGANNGVAGLDATGKVPLAQLPASIQGAMNYQGGWNAATNLPVITSSSGTKGVYYTVSTAGSTPINGVSQWNQGDHIAFNGTVWEKFDGIASEVISVAGRSGAVTLSVTDISGLGTAATAASSSFATSTQGTKADTAVQTVNGKSGNTITLSAADVGSLTQTTADARYATIAQGAKAATSVQTVNGTSPDASGNVTITVGSGTATWGNITGVITNQTDLVNYVSAQASGLKPINVTAPTVAGTAQQGQVLQRTNGLWVGSPTPVVTGNWRRNGINISGATSASYTLVAADIGKTISWEDSASNILATTKAASVESAVVTALPAPTVLTQPVLVGSPFVGQEMSYTSGAYSNYGVVTSASWEVAGVATGTTSATRIVQAGDLGKTIAVALTITNAATSIVVRTALATATGPQYSSATLSPLSADPFVLLSEPLVGNSITDPLSGQSVMRASDYTTDAIGSTHMRHLTSRQPVFNSDRSKYLLRSSDGRWVVYNTADATPVGSVSIEPGAEPIWSVSNPNELYHSAEYGGLIWYTRNVTTDTAVVLCDFTSKLAAFSGAARVSLRGGCPSADGRYWAFTAETTSFSHLGIFTWDKQTGNVIATLTAANHGGGSPEWLSMAPSGTHVVISWFGTNGTRSYNQALSSSVNLAPSAPYGDTCYGSSSQDLFCFQDEATHSIKVADCTTGTVFTLMTLIWGSGITQEFSRVTISGKAWGRPGWVFLAGYDEQFVDQTYAGTLSATREPWRKVMAARLVPNGTAYNVCFMQTTSDYGGAIGRPDAVPSTDGRKVLFASNFGGQSDVDAFICGLPDVLLPGAPAAPQFLGTSSITGTFLTNNLLTCNTGALSGEPYPTVHYQWSVNGTNAGTDSATFTATSPGTVACLITLVNSQGSMTRTVSVSVTSPILPLATQVSYASFMGQDNAITASSNAFDCAAGDLVIIATTWEEWPAGTTSSISDTSGNTYTGLGVVTNPDANVRLQLWYCLASAAKTGNVVTLSVPGCQSAPTQLRVVTYNPGVSHHFVFDTYAQASAGFSYGDISTAPFNTAGQGVVFVAFANNYGSITPWAQPAPANFSYIDNTAGPLTIMEQRTTGALTGVVATMPIGANYNRGCVAAASFITVAN